MNLIEEHAALYTPLDIEYAQAMSGYYADCCRQEDGGILIAGEKDGRVSGFWRPMVCFGSEDFQQGSIESIWAWCKDILYEDYLVGGVLSPISRFLLGKGYVAEPHYTQVIDLRKTVDELRRGLRKSYHSLVNKQDHVQLCGVNAFRIIHERVKGKTRCEESWAIQAKMDTVCFHDDGNCGVMFYCGPVWAYYASAAGDDTHACIWAALMELRQRGVKFCEMGTQEWGEGKLANIARYKSGFGGSTRVRLILRKA